MLTINSASKLVPRKLSSMSFILSVTCSSFTHSRTTNSTLLISKMISCVTSAMKYDKASLSSRKTMIATGINDDFLILLNSFLLAMKSKLKKV